MSTPSVPQVADPKLIATALVQRGYSKEAAKQLTQLALQPELQGVVAQTEKYGRVLSPRPQNHVPNHLAAIADQLARRPAARAGLAETNTVFSPINAGQFDRQNNQIELSSVGAPKPTALAHESEHSWQHQQQVLPEQINASRKDYATNPPQFERLTARGDNLYSLENVAYLPRTKTTDHRYAPYPTDDELISLDRQRFDLDAAAAAALNARNGSGFVVSRGGELQQTNLLPSSPLSELRPLQMTRSAADLAELSLVQKLLKRR
jgi:hypothetical protein